MATHTTHYRQPQINSNDISARARAKIREAFVMGAKLYGLSDEAEYPSMVFSAIDNAINECISTIVGYAGRNEEGK